MESDKRINRMVLLLIIVLLGIGGFLRMTSLGRVTMGADVMEYYKIAQRGVAPGELLTNSDNYLGRMPPLWFATHNAFLQFFKLPVTFANARIPDAIVGLLTILAAFLLGRELKDNRVGLVAACFVTFQPLLIQMSRECYFYAPIVLGCMLGLLAVLKINTRLAAGRYPSVWNYVLFFAALLLVTNIQISSWAYAVIMVAAIYIMFIVAAIKKRTSWMPVVVMTVMCLIAGIPTLLASWGVSDVMHLMFGEGKEQWGNIFESAKENSFVTAWTIISSFLFGKGLIRSVLNLVVLALGIFALVRGWKDQHTRVFTYFTGGAVLLLGIIHTMSVFPPTPRHFSSIVPMLVMLVALGIVAGCDWLVEKIRKPQLAGSLLPVGGALLLILTLNGWAAWLSTQLTGQPPYNQVAAWADANLPKGTVILCDRWFTPWNEFRMHPTTNVSFTYTVPNEPVQIYSQVQWRDTAKQFFELNPSAAFYEGREYWVEIGPWEWPHTYFARKQVFADSAGMVLDKMGLHYRPMPANYPREWLPVTIYYNTEEDILAKARAAGRKTLATFGEGWDYTKTQDHRGWHVMPQQATLALYNLTDAPVETSLILRGTAVNGNRSISVAPGVSATFQPNRMQEIVLGPLTLQPGKNSITCSSVGMNAAQVPLLIYQAVTRETP